MDVRACAALHRLLSGPLVGSPDGVAVIVVPGDLDELRGLCDASRS